MKTIKGQTTTSGRESNYVEIKKKPVCKCGLWFNTKVNCPYCYVKAKVQR